MKSSLIAPHNSLSPSSFHRTDADTERGLGTEENKGHAFHEVIAERIIAMLKAGTAPWQRPWDGGDEYSGLPFNPTTGKRYKGINLFALMTQGRSDSRWMTYRQAAATGAQVRKGERGTRVQYWQIYEEVIRRDGAGNTLRNANGEPIKDLHKLDRPRVFGATVFNAEQMDGMPLIARPVHTWPNVLNRAETLLAASGADIRHSTGSMASYHRSGDFITMPDKRQFSTPARYFATAFHELAHWTGHRERLDRDCDHPFASEGYAREELRAEIASLLLGEELAIGHDPEQHAAYVQSWIKVLQDDSFEIVRAAADAEKICAYILAFEPTLDAKATPHMAGHC